MQGSTIYLNNSIPWGLDQPQDVGGRSLAPIPWGIEVKKYLILGADTIKLPYIGKKLILVLLLLHNIA